MPNQLSISLTSFQRTLTEGVTSQFNEVRTLGGRYLTAIKSQWSHAPHTFQTYLQNINAIAKRQFANFYEAEKGLLWRYRLQLIGGAALITVGVALYHLWKKWEATKLKEVKADLKSTLNLATLSVEVLAREQKPIDVMLTLVVDKSLSMQTADHDGTRQKAVAEAICGILESSKAYIQAPKNAKIRVAITAFNHKVENIQEMTRLTSENIQEIQKKVNAIKSVGNTSIITGLQGALKEVEKVKDCDHTLILLTDGESENPDFELIHKRFASAKVKVYAIGIGANHKKDLLKKFAEPKDANFEGKYIDMTQNTSTIAKVVADIYAQVISSHYLRLNAPLEPGAWTLAEKASIAGSAPDQSCCDIGLLAEGEQKDLVIRIQPGKLKGSLDLSKLVFTLSNGLGQSLPLPWNANTIIDRDILAAATKIS